MNRIVLIGNGFDLSHGLETKYSHFIDYYWAKKVEPLELRSFPHTYDEGTMAYKYDDKEIYISFPVRDEYVRNFINNTKTVTNYKTLDRLIKKCNGNLKIRNKFFEIITLRSMNNWVDIEEEFNKQLQGIISGKSEYVDIQQLNNDFSHVKRALEKYLTEIVNKYKQKLNCTILHHIYSYFDMRDFTEKGIERVSEEEYKKFYKLTYSNRVCPSPKPTILDLSEKTLLFLNKYQHLRGLFDKSNFKKLILDETLVSNYFYLLPKQILFLNFNYTDIEKKYYEHDHFKGKTEGYISEMKNIEKNVIHIHGELMNKKNAIIFGYGDELDDNYKIIEKRNDNKFLENIKSIKYLETDNYKRLLNFINADMYQIFVMGHSCGISDRTLLNTLFEHKNCVSIKVFYYQFRDENDEIKDNYSDIVRNISRNFNNKAVMREKVVNKQYSKPLT